MTVPMPTGFLKRLSFTVARWYSLACARDDASSHRFHVPSGLWACGRCHYVSFDALGLHRHIGLAHAAQMY